MLKCTPAALRDEINASVKHRDVVLSQASELVEQYRSGVTGEKPKSRDNHPFEYVSVAIPQLAFNNPRASVTSRQRGKSEAVAKAINCGLNRWVVDTNLRSPLQAVAVDFMFTFGAMVTTAAPAWQKNRSTPIFWPVTKRLSPKRFVWDLTAATPEECQWMGHVCVAYKDDLLEEARKNPSSGWDTAALSKASEDDGTDELGRPQTEKVSRKEFVYYEVWVPGAKLDGYEPSDGFNGVIYTLPYRGFDGEANDGAKWVRKPRPFYGPAWGPYSFFGAYGVPDDMRPMSPLLAVFQNVKEVEAHGATISESAKRYKRFVLFESGQKALGKALKNGKHDTVIPVESFDPKYAQQYEVGGITPQMVEQYQLEKSRLDQLSGMSDAIRGTANKSTTATGDTIAAQAASSRMSFLKKQFIDATQTMLRTVAWYLYHDDRIIFSLGSEDANELGMQAPVFMGGNLEDQSGMSFDDLELEIDPYSMERVDEGLMQKRANEVFQLITAVAPAIPQAPYLDWKWLLEMMGNVHNMSGLSDVVNMEAVKNMAQGMAGPTKATFPRIGGTPTPGQSMGQVAGGAYA